MDSARISGTAPSNVSRVSNEAAERQQGTTSTGRNVRIRPRDEKAPSLDSHIRPKMTRQRNSLQQKISSITQNVQQCRQTETSKVGNITCENTRFLEDINKLKEKSPTLCHMFNSIKEKGGLKINLDLNVSRSFYDNGSVTIALKDRGVQRSKESIHSEFIIELCNAFHDKEGIKPNVREYKEKSRMDYAIAMEKMEWQSTKKHVDVLTELGNSDGGAKYNDLSINRFKPGFPEGNNTKGWHTFEGYLKDQMASGHTEMIARHHDNFLSKEDQLIRATATPPGKLRP